MPPATYRLAMVDTDSAADRAAEHALEAFDIGGITGLRRITTGLIHRTYAVETSRGKFVLQRLHPDLSSDSILADFEAVTKHLALQKFPAPALIKTGDGRAAADADGGRYRLITFMEGETYDEVRDDRMASEAALILGAYHRAMGEFRHEFLAGRPLHDSPAHFRWMNEAVERSAGAGIAGRLSDDIRRINDLLPRHFLPGPLPSRVVHGDPKISNVLFDPSTGRACGVVDLDSTARHTILVDIGDAVRSWCRSGPEDKPTPCLTDRFRSVCEGYRASGAMISHAEIALIPQACRLITIELAARFVRDAIEDRYFGWDPARFSSRVDHNVARARGCLYQAESMMEQSKAMEQTVRDVFGTR